MSHSRVRLMAVVFAGALSVTFASPAAAQGGAGSVSLTVKIGVDPSIGGVFQPGATGTLNGADVTINQNDWTDTHKTRAPLFVAGLGFGLSSSAEVLANFEYGSIGSQSLEIGVVDGEPLTGDFDKYKFWGLETGVRLGSTTSPGGYGIATVGFRQVSAIDGTFRAAGQFAFPSYYDKSTVPTFGFGGGFVFGDYSFAVGVEVMVKYAGALKQGSLDLAGTGLEAINTRGERWSLPISLVLRF